MDKLKALVFSFALGNDSLSDLDQLNKDDLFCSLVVGGNCSSTSMGDFLRSFGPRQVEKFQEVFMEGLDWNYKDMWCLDSQNVYDQYGFSYLFDLRPGNTFSGKEAESNQILERPT